MVYFSACEVWCIANISSIGSTSGQTTSPASASELAAQKKMYVAEFGVIPLGEGMREFSNLKFL